jgi:hypothetical protein
MGYIFSLKRRTIALVLVVWGHSRINYSFLGSFSGLLLGNVNILEVNSFTVRFVGQAVSVSTTSFSNFLELLIRVILVHGLKDSVPVVGSSLLLSNDDHFGVDVGTLLLLSSKSNSLDFLVGLEDGSGCVHLTFGINNFLLSFGKFFDSVIFP